MSVIRKVGIILLVSGALLSCNKDDDVTDTSIVSAGVFGGSIASRDEINCLLFLWENNLNIKMKVKRYGKGGAGFSTLTYNNIPEQIKNAPILDVYILWASTNDAVYSYPGAVGNLDISTQSGGIYRAVDEIYKKNSEAIILFLNSLPSFDSRYYMKVQEFAKLQLKICETLHIKSLDQNLLCGFDWENMGQYYYDDCLHLEELGYLSLFKIHKPFLDEMLIPACRLN